MLLCFAFFGVARADEVMIGDAESTTTQYTLPVNTYYHYSLTQQIFTADEIGMAGTISSIAFDYAYTDSFTMNNVQVYMMNVDKASFESTTDMVQISASDLVWEGTFTATGAGWVTLDLDTPFVYDGTSNLLVCFYDPTSGYPGSSFKFRTTATTDYLALAYYSDGSSPSLTDVNNWSGSKLRYQYRNNITLNITASGGPTCTKPSDMLISNVTPTGATIAWTSDVNNYNFEYKKSSETEWTSIGLEANTYTLTNLMPNTAYNVRVQAVCDTDLTSGWLTSSFTTPAGIPLVEPFNTTSIPNGWTRYTGLLDDVMAGTLTPATTTSGWNFGTYNGVFDNHARVNIYSTGIKYWLVTPSLEMENNVQLTFDLALTKYSGTLQPVVPANQADDRFVVLIATFGADTTLTILREWNNTGSEYVYDNITCSVAGENVAIDLSSYAGQNIAIAFYGESTEAGGDNNLHIDNVSIDYIPACAKPTSVAATDITAHEATLNWVSDADAWVVAYKTAAEENFTEVTVHETPYTISGLAPETAYTAKVRSSCGGTLSEWSNTVNFTTAVACVVPTSFTTSNVTNHGATLKWVSDADEWIVAYKVTADTDFTEITVSDTTYTFTTLDPETNYTVKVRANCGGEDGMSAWTSTRTFTTLVACPAPNNFAYSELTTTTVTLDWTERGDATEWDLQYWMVGADTTLVTVTEKPYLLSNLITDNVYGARVRSACGSDWSSTITFEPTAKLVIGSGSGTSGYLPTNTNYNYSYTQQIYTVEELGEAGLFESIDFYMTSTSAYTRNLDIYMVSTDKSAFESTTDYISVTDADKVFSGEVAFEPQSWTTITLDAGFVYNGTQNVAIIVDDNTGVYSSRYFKSFTTNTIQSHYCYQDGSDINPNSPSAQYNYTGTSKNQIRILKIELSDCMKPTRLVATEVGPNFIKLSWTENGDASEWTVNYNGNMVTANTNEEFELTGLEPETEYTIVVSPSCDETVLSDAIIITTLEACPVPEEVTVSDTTITYNAATVTWFGYNDSYNVQLGWDEITATYLNENFADGISADWDNGSDYPWEVVNGHIQSSNAGVGSSTSSISITVSFTADGTVQFDAECMGEGTSTAWDKCIFSIDDEAQFTYGAHVSGWNHYSFPVTAGEHTFTWSYTKDSSVNPTGDYFAVDNIMMSTSEITWGEPVSVENAEYTFTSLTPKTTYYVKVQGVCGETETEWSDVATFTTLEQTNVTQTITLTAGTNWVSTYLEITKEDLQNALVAALSDPAGTVIKSQNGNSTYRGGRWRDQSFTWDVAKMYKIVVPEDCEITLTGMPINPAEHPITIAPNAPTWIGFPFAESMTPAQAIPAGFAVNGDIIKGKDGNARYGNGNWRAQGLNSLEPGKGYM